MQPDVPEKNRTGNLVSRILSRLKKSKEGDEGRASDDPAAARKPVVRFQDLDAGSGVAQQLKHIKDAASAAAAQKLKETNEAEAQKKKDGKGNGESNDYKTEILPADIDRWMPGHWLRSQYLEDVISGPDSDISTRAQMMKKYIEEEKTVSKNASTSFKFGFSKSVRMKMEQDALAAQRLAEHEMMKEMARNRLDTTTVFDVKHDIFCKGLPALQADQLPKMRLLASNWFQRLATKPPGSSALVFATITLPGERKARLDWGAMYCPRGADPANRDSLGLLYMGTLEAGAPHAYGECHFENGDIYQGEMKGGKSVALAPAVAIVARFVTRASRLTGCGKYWYRCLDEVTCGDFYEGFFLNSCKSGVGAYTFGTAKAKFIGEFVNNKFCGFGIYTSRSESYTGSFLDDKRHGQGVATFHPISASVRESLYVGEFSSSRRHGLGRLSFVNCSVYFGEFRHGHMHGIGTLACFDGCKLFGTWHLGRRHGQFLIQRPSSKDCQVILYDLDVPVWSRCMVSSDLVELSTPSVAVMVKVENMCAEIEAHCTAKALFFADRVRKSSEYLNGKVLENVKACVEQARFQACQHTLFNICFGISNADIRVIRVDGERRNVYNKDYDLFNQGVDDDMAAAAAKDVTTTQKIVRVVQRLQKSMAQGPEPVKIARKSKAELQAEETAKAAEEASNELENAIREYEQLLKHEKTQKMDKLVLLLTVLKKVSARAKLTAEHVYKLASMQSNEADTLKVITHFMAPSDAANNFDWERRTYVPSGPRARGVRRESKELVALPPQWIDRIRRLLQNIIAGETLANEAARAMEQILEWFYYCELASSNDLARFRMFVNVKNHFARSGKNVLPPVGPIEPGATVFDDDLVKTYTAEMTVKLSDSTVKPAAVEDDGDIDSSSSDDSVDFSLRMRRFQPMSIADMRADDHHTLIPPANAARGVASSRNAALAISDSDSDSGGSDNATDQIRTSAVAAPFFPQGNITAASRAASASVARRDARLSLAPNLLFSPMKRGSATQLAARSRDRASSDDASDDAS